MMTAPLILAVETSSRVGSVAIARGSGMLGETRFSAPLRHSAEVIPAIQGLLDSFDRKPAEIEQVYISVGPGSFTGLRIAVALAKTMHLANAARIVAVDTLDVIAANVISLSAAGTSVRSNHELPDADCDRIAVVLDAKRGRFFITGYQRQAAGPRIWRKAFPDSLMTIREILIRFAHEQNPIWLLGDGLVYHKDKFQADGVRFFDEKYWSPRASNVHLLGWQMALEERFVEPLTLTPNYLRKPDVTLKSR
jgi:tRNA threonylcarbamoyladenosine biosynthesis protein TsaB